MSACAALLCVSFSVYAFQTMLWRGLCVAGRQGTLPDDCENGWAMAKGRDDAEQKSSNQELLLQLSMFHERTWMQGGAMALGVCTIAVYHRQETLYCRVEQCTDGNNYV